MPNPRIKYFTDIVAWRKAQELTISVYALSRNIRDYAYADQIKRASISIMNNIAEGYGRYNPKEFKQFLSISKGSLLEVQSMLYLGEQLKYIAPEKVVELVKLTIEVDSLITGFIKTLVTKIESDSK